LGLTAGVNIAYTQKNNPVIYDGNNGGRQAKNSKLLQNAFYAGAKYSISCQKKSACISAVIMANKNKRLKKRRIPYA